MGRVRDNKECKNSHDVEVVNRRMSILAENCLKVKKKIDTLLYSNIFEQLFLVSGNGRVFALPVFQPLRRVQF